MNKKHESFLKVAEKYPDRIPIIVHCQSGLSLLNNRFLVPKNMKVSQFLYILRGKLDDEEVTNETALFIFINNQIPTAAATWETIANEQKQKYLNVTLCKENVFGVTLYKRE